MRFRLVSDEVVFLYSSGKSDSLSPLAIRRFFGAVEAIESAESEEDLFALVSLDATRSGREGLKFPLAGEIVLKAQQDHDHQGALIAILGIERSGK